MRGGKVDDESEHIVSVVLSYARFGMADKILKILRMIRTGYKGVGTARLPCECGRGRNPRQLPSMLSKCLDQYISGNDSSAEGGDSTYVQPVRFWYSSNWRKSVL